MKNQTFLRVGALTGLLWLGASLNLPAQVPQLLHYQGRAIVANTNFEGPGQFKFALVNADGSHAYWNNDGTSAGGDLDPSAGVALTVTKGLYAVLLGDTTLPHMTAVPATVFTNTDVRLRVWFNGGSGYQVVLPDQRIAAVGYSMVAASVPDGAITAAKLAPDAVGAANVQDGSLTAGKLAAGQVVKSLNSLTDNVNLIGVGNVTVTPSGNNLQISTIGTLIIENRTSDPPSPAIGQLWLRTDQ